MLHPSIGPFCRSAVEVLLVALLVLGILVAGAAGDARSEPSDGKVCQTLCPSCTQFCVVPPKP